MTPRALRNVSAALATLAVVAVYAYFASYGRYSFHSRPWDVPGGRPADAYYGSLAEGFRRGQLSMAHRPDAALTALANPYDYAEREKNKVPYLWDASYLNGRYYLYFTPLPALLVYLPHRLIYGAYPSDQLAAAIFAAWAAIMAALFLRRAFGDRRLHVPLWLWIGFAGLGNLAVVVMVYSRTYEVATFCGMAMTATWAWCLLRFLETPTNARLLWASVWLALSIAARPNLAVLCMVMAIAIAMARRAGRLKAAAIAAIPLAIVGSMLAAYNYARFHNPLEFGHRYQLTYMSMADRHVCSCRTPREAIRLLHTSWLYVATPLNIGGEFPFVRLTQQTLDEKVSFDGSTDAMAGLGAFAPLAILGSVFAAILALRRGARDEPRGGLLVMAAGWLALAGLSTCWYASARYELDFMLLIALGTAVCVEAMLTYLAELGVSPLPLRAIAVVLICASIAAGILLGFADPNGEFAQQNPKHVARIAVWFK